MTVAVGVEKAALGGASCIGCGKSMRAPMGILGIVECAPCQAAVAAASARRRREGLSLGSLFGERRSASMIRRRTSARAASVAMREWNGSLS